MASAGKVSPIVTGEYRADRSYTRLDIAYKDGSSYIAKKDNNNIPVTNTEYWQIMAEGGASITVDSAMSDTSANPVQNKVIKAYVDEAQGVTLTGTLTAGQTTLELVDASITTDSTIDPYTSNYKVVATDIVVSTGKVTLTFDAQTENVSVKVVVK